ncbi:MAG TPA: thioredoxin fold domain-containing protein [Chthonomonadaceae bacterium]|nr:thioredoxin fold domain-containing protein [Chthonomonadaceae bacterium]
MKSSKYIGWLPLCCALLCAGVLGAIRDNRYGGDIAWAGSYQAGVQLAQKTHRPLLICFHAPNCGWCDKMDAETFTDPRVVERSKRYVCVRIESDVDADLVQRYGVISFPTILLTDPNGKSQHEITGYIAPESFAAALK